MGNRIWLFCECKLLGEEDWGIVLRRLLMRFYVSLLIVEKFFVLIEENTVNNDYEKHTNYVEEVDESSIQLILIKMKKCFYGKNKMIC